MSAGTAARAGRAAPSSDERPAWSSTGRGATGSLKRLISGIRWYVTSLMGDTAYERYVQHRALSHPGEAPLTEREFWRMRYAEQGDNPGSRCC